MLYRYIASTETPRGVCVFMFPRKNFQNLLCSQQCFVNFPFTEMPSCSHESTLIPSSLKKFALVPLLPITKTSSSLDLITLRKPSASNICCSLKKFAHVPLLPITKTASSLDLITLRKPSASNMCCSLKKFAHVPLLPVTKTASSLDLRTLEKPSASNVRCSKGASGN